MAIGRTLSEVRTHPTIRLAVLVVIFVVVSVSLSTSYVEAQTTLKRVNRYSRDGILGKTATLDWYSVNQVGHFGRLIFRDLPMLSEEDLVNEALILGALIPSLLSPATKSHNS